MLYIYELYWRTVSGLFPIQSRSMDGIFSTLSFSSVFYYLLKLVLISMLVLKCINLAIQHNAPSAKTSSYVPDGFTFWSNLHSKDHFNNSICPKRVSVGYCDTARLNLSNPQKRNLIGVSIIPRPIKGFYRYILLNHLKITCRHHETPSINISAYISWG